jgi:hypothetical protein
MQRHPALLAILLSLSACQGDVADLYVGGYDMEMDDVSRPCGEPAAEPFVHAYGRTWELEPLGGGRLLLNGACDFTFAARTGTRAEFEPSTCDVTVEGVALHYELRGGEMFLDRERREIWGSWSYRVTEDGLTCTMGSTSFYGWGF